ncbi:preprotein translocase subunit YajC [Akkermansia muciniphila]|nr:preprotein translocase subunit YajC [Akkermansia muciniphila]
MSSGGASMLTTSFSLILMLVIFYFFLIRPQSKRNKEEQKMRSSLPVGDEIVTVGGIVGRVVNIKDDDILVETGSDRVKLRIKRVAISSVTPLKLEDLSSIVFPLHAYLLIRVMQEGIYFERYT